MLWRQVQTGRVPRVCVRVGGGLGRGGRGLLQVIVTFGDTKGRCCGQGKCAVGSGSWQFE
jgi:hypothetical protein